MRLESFNPELRLLGPSTKLWAKLVDQLTSVDPNQRLSADEAIELLEEIEFYHRTGLKKERNKQKTEKDFKFCF